MRYLLILLAAFGAASLDAQSNVVIPNANTGAEGATGNNGAFYSQSFTMQYYLHRSQLGAIPNGSRITGMSFRLDGGQPTYGSPITIAQYDIGIAQSDAASFAANNLASTTFANNMGPAVTTVFAGTLNIAANSLLGGSMPNAFSYTITFATPYFYAANTDIVILCRQSAGPSMPPAFDAVQPAAGLCTALCAQGYSATTANPPLATSPAVIQLDFSAPPSGPELDVLLGTQDVVAGSTQMADMIVDLPFTRTYTLVNRGSAPLQLLGASPVAATLVSGAASVGVTTQPAATIAPFSTTSFAVVCTPSASGAYEFTLAIASNDADENPYQWTVRGNVVDPASAINAASKLGGLNAGCAASEASHGAAWAMLLLLAPLWRAWRRKRS